MDQRQKTGIQAGALVGAVVWVLASVLWRVFQIDTLIMFSFLGAILGWLAAIIIGWVRPSNRQSSPNKIEKLKVEYGFNPFGIFSHVFNEEAARMSVMGSERYDESGTEKLPFVIGVDQQKYDAVLDKLLTGDKTDVEVLDELTDLMEEYYGHEYSLPRNQRGGSWARWGDQQSLRFLGQHPVTKAPVILRQQEDTNIVEYRDMNNLDTVTLSAKSKEGRIGLAEACDLLDGLTSLPRKLGETPDGLAVSASVGRFGPYVRYGDKYVSIKDDDPYTIELPRALELIELKKIEDANRIIQDFEDDGIQVLNGRYGPYVTDSSINARVPKDRDPKSLSLDECKTLLAEAPTPARSRRPVGNSTSSDKDNSAPPGIAERRPKFDIEEDSWSGANSALKTLCISQSDLSIRWHLNKFYPDEKAEFSRLGSREIDGRHFDVYEGTAGATNREYWMDVSYWYGRGLDMSPKRSLPLPGKNVTALEFFAGPSMSNLPLTSEQFEASRDFLSQFNVRFCTWSSNVFSQAVATPPKVLGESPAILTTAVRQYIDEDLPLLHGFRFLAPFVAHQIYHPLIGEISDCHTELKADYYRPEPGVECIDFDWLPSDSPADDFWNYMLAAHKPGAFSVDGERYALLFSIKSMISDGYVSSKELYQALQKMRIAKADKDQLCEVFDDT